jgi:hypothetical protein
VPACAREPSPFPFARRTFSADLAAIEDRDDEAVNVQSGQKSELYIEEDSYLNFDLVHCAFMRSYCGRGRSFVGGGVAAHVEFEKKEIQESKCMKH